MCALHWQLHRRNLIWEGGLDLFLVLCRWPGGLPRAHKASIMHTSGSRCLSHGLRVRMPVQVNRAAVAAVEQDGIVFLDEIDKIVVNPVSGVRQIGPNVPC